MRYLVPAFDTQLLNGITREHMQEFLNQKAQGFRRAWSRTCVGI